MTGSAKDMVQTTFSEKLKIRKSKNKKIEISPYMCVRVCVKGEKLGIFPDVDAIKRQEMPNLPLFSVSGGFKLKNGIVIGFASRNALRGL